MSPVASSSPLVLLGLEAADFHLVRRWAEAGHLPTISSVMERGCWGRLAGPDMVSEHGVWVSLYSGLSRADHGYYYWKPLKTGTYDLQLADFEALGTLPFWRRLGNGTRKLAIIDPPEAHPMPGPSGVQLGNWAPHNARYPTCSFPEELLDDLRRRFGPPMYVEERIESTPSEDGEIRAGLLKQIEQKGAICRHLVEKDRYDLIVVTFFESHVAGHQFLRYQSDQVEESENGLESALRDVYRAIDEQLGLLIETLPEASNVFILSNVGLHEEYPSRKLLEAFCRELGYRTTASSPAAGLSALRWAENRVPRSLRIVVKDRLPNRLLQRAQAEAFRSETDWSRTTVFPLPSLYTGFLRVNLRGREPQGIVNPGREYDELLDRLEDDLSLLHDPVSNLPAVKKVTRTTRLFGGDPPLSLPDLFVIWRPTSYLVEKVLHPKGVLVQEDPDFRRGSHHTHHGFVAAAGPAIRPAGYQGDVDVLDLAPTFLTLLNERIPDRLKGTPLEDVMLR